MTTTVGGVPGGGIPSPVDGRVHADRCSRVPSAVGGVVWVAVVGGGGVAAPAGSERGSKGGSAMATTVARGGGTRPRQ